MQAKLPLDTASSMLGDAGNARWSRESLRAYLSAGLGVLASVKPEAFAELRAIQLVAGAVQTVPSDVTQFMGAIRNMGSDGLTPGGTIRNPAVESLDHFQTDWMSATPGAEIEDCYYNLATPDTFMVYPPVAAAPTVVHIQVRVSKEPAAVALDTDELGLKTTYLMPLVHWLLSMAYAENTDRGDKQLALAHEQQFYQALGMKAQAEAGAPPRSKEDAS